jgi:hypothetical protein
LSEERGQPFGKGLRHSTQWTGELSWLESFAIVAGGAQIFLGIHTEIAALASVGFEEKRSAIWASSADK